MLKHYNGSYVRALLELYPKIGLKATNFVPSMFSLWVYSNFIDYLLVIGLYWGDSSNRRKLLEEFAKLKHFNPLQVGNWYKTKGYDLAKFFPKESRFINRYDWTSILQDAFPELKFDVEQFKGTTRNFKDVATLKKFFNITSLTITLILIDYSLNELAKEKGFDPDIPDNWYEVTREDMEAKEVSPNTVL